MALLLPLPRRCLCSVARMPYRDFTLFTISSLCVCVCVMWLCAQATAAALAAGQEATMADTSDPLAKARPPALAVTTVLVSFEAALKPVVVCIVVGRRLLPDW
jgi:hypothetical protein